MIELKEVTKRYNEKVVLDRVGLKINTGETVVILGENGSGKSTLLKLIMGLERPDSGQIFIEDQDITRLKESQLMEIRSKFGMVFQEAALFDSLTVRENVGFRLYEDPKSNVEEADRTVRRLLGFVGLEDAVDKMPAELSGGMRRRVSIARAMVGNPKTLLYDEPTAGLDTLTSKTILDLIVALRDLEGVTSIVVTHDLKTARLIANEYATKKPDGTVEIITGKNTLCVVNVKFVILHEGKIIFEGTSIELQNANDEYVKKFISQ